MSAPRVISVNRSSGGIPKRPIERGQVTEAGLLGDAHDHEKHRTPLQAISVIDMEDLEDLEAEGFDVFPGATGENLTVRGLSVDELAVGDRLELSGGTLLELSKRRQPCYVLDAIDPRLKTAIRNRCGFYARVIRGGAVAAGETVRVLPVERREDAADAGPPIPAASA